MLLQAGIAVVAAAGAFVAVVALRPNTFRVVRSTVIGVPPGKVHPLVADFRAWEHWSPWAKIDPQMQVSYSGVPASVGSGYAWKGNRNVGEGRMTLTESEPPSRLRIRLEFIKPFAGVNDVVFTFRPSGPGTEVRWEMSGNYVFFTKAVALFVSMDRMIGGDFEKGLAQMKELAER